MDMPHPEDLSPCNGPPHRLDDSVPYRTYPPRDLSFIGPLPSSREGAIRDFNAWNRSTEGCFPSQSLRGPGETGPPLPSLLNPATTTHKRKRATSPDNAAVGGYGPMPSSPGEKWNQSAPDPNLSHTTDYTGPQNIAYEIWAFVRPADSDEKLQVHQWPNDYDQHLNRRPDSLFVSCKLCTQFGNSRGIKAWKVFSNRRQTSPTSTVRQHFEHEHKDTWKHECCRLGVPQKNQTERASNSNMEPFTREGLVMRLQKFVVSDDQSINVIDNPHFRELLLYLGQGHVTDDEIPKRTYLTQSIIKAWKDEREQFHQEMKKSLGRISLTTDGWSTPNLVSFLGVTAHFIVRNQLDGQLILRSGLLAFQHIQGSHTGEHLSEVLYKIIKGAGVEQRIGSITADNASNNDTMMQHLEAHFTGDGIPFDHHGNRVRCFPHVINLAVQAIYAALKDGKGLEEQYLLGELRDCFSETVIKAAVLPPGVAVEDYLEALTSDVLGVARKLIAACRISGKRREEFVDTIIKGNTNEAWVDDNGNLISRKTLELLRDCETRWSSTHLMVDRVLVMLPVIKVFSKRPNMSDANIAIPTVAETCVLDHVRTITSVPHDAQESLSSERTPTLSYSLPFYHAIVDEWEDLKEDYPLLAPFIEVGIRKIEEYIDKSKLSRTYLLAILLNPCLKMKWIEENCSVDSVQRTRKMALDAMLVFKKADSEAKHGNLSGYTVAPTHPLKSIAASTVRFLDRTMSRKPVSVQSAYGGISNYNTVLDSCELRSELDNYLCEPRADLFKTTMQDSESGPRVFWCDPLRYWMGAEGRFPYLFRLAMDILPAQASAVACERLFSSGKETCTPRRNRINPDLMEALQTLKFSFRSGALDLTKHVEDTLYSLDKTE